LQSKAVVKPPVLLITHNILLTLKIKIMAIKKVWIEQDCTACGLCVDISPDVFELPGEIAVVKEGANFGEHEDEIKEAAESCPVEVIRYEE
jgi:ferredoxin